MSNQVRIPLERDRVMLALFTVSLPYGAYRCIAIGLGHDDVPVSMAFRVGAFAMGVIAWLLMVWSFVDLTLSFVRRPELVLDDVGVIVPSWYTRAPTIVPWAAIRAASEYRLRGKHQASDKLTITYVDASGLEKTLSVGDQALGTKAYSALYRGIERHGIRVQRS